LSDQLRFDPAPSRVARRGLFAHAVTPLVSANPAWADAGGCGTGWVEPKADTGRAGALHKRAAGYGQSRAAAVIDGPDPGSVVGSLRITATGPVAPLLRGRAVDDVRAGPAGGTLDGVIHHAGTAVPGRSGNAVFSAVSGGRLTRPLVELDLGDELSFAMDGLHQYQVTDTLVVRREEAWVAGPTLSPIATIIVPVWGQPGRRHVVVAELRQPAGAGFSGAAL
jgi:hypothetical protein